MNVFFFETTGDYRCRHIGTYVVARDSVDAMRFFRELSTSGVKEEHPLELDLEWALYYLSKGEDEAQYHTMSEFAEIIAVGLAEYYDSAELAGEALKRAIRKAEMLEWR